MADEQEDEKNPIARIGSYGKLHKTLIHQFPEKSPGCGRLVIGLLQLIGEINES